jgi:2-dehydro-3-deoxygluconokinase
MNASIDILACGEPLFEFNQTDAGSRDYRAGFGGDTSNCAIAAARQGARSGYLSAVGADRFGQDFLDLWDREGVDRRHVRIRDDAPTGLYFVHHDKTGHHFSYRRKGSAASLMTPADLPENAFDNLKILHLSGISLAISDTACDAGFKAIELARAQGALIAFDTNLRPNLWPLPRARAIIQAAASMADILLPGLDDARMLTGFDQPEVIADHYLGLGARIVALTLGREGCLIATGTTSEHLPPHQVDAVDATGAGDTFDGAFLAEFLNTSDVMAAARYANAAAALATTGFGAVAPIPKREQVEAYLTSR